MHKDEAVTFIKSFNIYLFIIRESTPTTAGSAGINAKERDKKERKVRRAKERKWIEARR